jgi:hypothetical protein
VSFGAPDLSFEYYSTYFVVFFAGIKARHIIPKRGFLVKPIDCGLGAVMGLFFEVKLTIIWWRKPKRLAAVQKIIRFSFEYVKIILFRNVGKMRLLESF